MAFLLVKIEKADASFSLQQSGGKMLMEALQDIVQFLVL